MLGLAALLTLTMQQPGLVEVAGDLPRWCAEQAGARSTDVIETAEGDRLIRQSRGTRCTLRIEVFPGDNGQITQGIHDHIVGSRFGWSVIRWREPQINESGPSVWSHIEDEAGGYIRLIEPAPGHRGDWSMEYSGGD